MIAHHEGDIWGGRLDIGTLNFSLLYLWVIMMINKLSLCVFWRGPSKEIVISSSGPVGGSNFIFVLSLTAEVFSVGEKTARLDVDGNVTSRELPVESLSNLCRIVRLICSLPS